MPIASQEVEISMSNFEQGSGFRIAGSVVRKYVNPQGTFASLTVEVFIDGRKKLLEMRAFKDTVGDIAELTQGALVTVTGSVDSEKLTAKDKSAVQVDGRDAWVAKLTARKVVVAAVSKPAETKAAHPLGDETIDW
jgi:hypothetical protein